MFSKPWFPIQTETYTAEISLEKFRVTGELGWKGFSGDDVGQLSLLCWVKVETRGGKEFKNKKHVPGSSCQGNPNPVSDPNPGHEVWALTSLMSPTPNWLSQAKGILMGSLVCFSYRVPFLLSLQIK